MEPGTRMSDAASAIERGHSGLLRPESPAPSRRRFSCGIQSAPYLADHGFQDMVVLPGAYYVDLALRMERDLTQRTPAQIRNVAFHSPVILGTEDAVIEVEAREHGDGRLIKYVFFEGNGDAARASDAAPKPVAELEIDRGAPRPRQAVPGAESPDAFKARPHTEIDAQHLYQALRRNGNQYGPAFQNVRAIWQSGDQCLGRLSFVPPRDATHCLHPSLLDSVTQLLAPFAMEAGRTFILTSIGRIALAEDELPES